MTPRLLERIATWGLVLLLLWGGKTCYDRRVAEAALDQQELERLAQERDALRTRYLADSTAAAAAADSAARARVERDSIRAAYRRLATRPPRIVEVPVPTETGDTVMIPMVPKSYADSIIAAADSALAADSVALAREQAAHAATRALLADVEADRDNLLQVNATIRRALPSRTEKVVHAGKWMGIGAGLFALGQAVFK